MSLLKVRKVKKWEERGRKGKQVAEQLMSATNVQARMPEANVFDDFCKN
jgi:DNA-binding transcriptional regulator YiaG